MVLRLSTQDEQEGRNILRQNRKKVNFLADADLLKFHAVHLPRHLAAPPGTPK
jgi:succinyl-CoA synthetase beta subunit